MDQRPEANQTITDAQLIGRHLAGDGTAFEAIIRRYRLELYNFLFRLIGDGTLADDAFQETFLQLHISAGAFDPQKPLRPWLFTIAANKARDALRIRARRHAAPLDAVMPSDESDGTSYADVIPADIPPPHESLMNLETRSAVWKIVEAMPEHLRTALVLAYFHEMPYAEIAEVVNVPLGTVKSRLHAAVAHFAEKWKAAAGKSNDGTGKTPKRNAAD